MHTGFAAEHNKGIKLFGVDRGGGGGGYGSKFKCTVFFYSPLRKLNKASCFGLINFRGTRFIVKYETKFCCFGPVQIAKIRLGVKIITSVLFLTSSSVCTGSTARHETNSATKFWMIYSRLIA